MPTNNPTMEDWKKLFDLMTQVEELAPWEFMEEDDIFGFELPGTGELGFISVMGTLGEHFSIAIYQGARGLGGFWNMQALGDKMTPEVLLEVPQLQASFDDREEITKEDRDVMKQLGLKFRGAKAWPQFRSFRPGCIPWYIEKAEAEMLACGLEQLLEVAPRFRENPDNFIPTDNEADYLMRVQKDGVWTDTIQTIQSYEGTTVKLKMNMNALAALKQAMPGKAIIEVEFFMMNNPIQEKPSERPCFPYMLMVCDHDSRFILCTELLKPLPSMEEMWAQIPMLVVEAMAGRFAPKEIQVNNDFMQALFGPLAAEVGFSVKKIKKLSAISAARRAMGRFF